MNLFVCHVLAVGSFSSFTCSATFRFTPFRYNRSLRSFHPPHHRTAKPIPSLHYANLHTGFPCPGIPITNTQNIHTVGIAHATPSHPNYLLHYVQSLHLLLPTTQSQLYALFFSAAYYPSLKTKSVSVKNQSLALHRFAIKFAKIVSSAILPNYHLVKDQAKTSSRHSYLHFILYF